jgi:predicted transcriptional regulator
MIENGIYSFFHKKGVLEVLNLLKTKPNQKLDEKSLFIELKNLNYYPSPFYQVKKQLLKLKLIQYELNEENSKVIRLTPKGNKLIQIINDLIKIINS